MIRDALASIRLAPIQVQLGEWTYQLPPQPAARWIEAVLIRDWTAIFPGMLGDAAMVQDVWRQIIAGQADVDDLERAAKDALERAGGRPWWEVQRLAHAATSERASSLIIGGLVRAGFDFGVRPFGAFLDAVYSFAVDGSTEDQRIKLDMELKTPPPGIDVEELYDDDEAAAEFQTMHALGDG